MVAFAAVVEHAGWTNGSLHNNILKHDPGSIAFDMIDVIAFISALLIITMSAAAYASLSLARSTWIKGKFASSRKQTLEKYS